MRKRAFPILVILLGTLAFSFMDFLFASQVGTVWQYNPVTDNREQIPEESQEEIVRYGRGDGQYFDLLSDTSFQRFLDDSHPFTTPNYVPVDLVPIDSHFTHNQPSRFFLRSEAALSFADMARAFADAFDFKFRLSITSTYRSPAFQKRLSANCSASRCADAWASEHEAGLALDLWVNGGNILSAGGVYYQRLYHNAHLYGFHNTYQKGVEIDGKMVEPRHRRYVGTELAAYLYATNKTFAEYFYARYPTS